MTTSNSAKASSAAQVNSNLVWQLVDKLDEQRRCPRIPLAAQADLRTAAGASIAAEVLNISPDGLQLRCTVEAARLLRPGSGRGETAPPAAPLMLTLALPIGADECTFAARCELLYLTTVDSEPRCVFGLRFSTVEAADERRLHAFFADQLGLAAPDAVNA